MAANGPEIDAIKNKIRQAYESGVATFKQLSEKYSVKEGTIKSWASREGWVKGNTQSKRDEGNKQPQLKKKVKVATKNNIKKDATSKDATKKSKKGKVAVKDASSSSKNKFQIQSYIEPEKPKELTEKEKLFCFYFARTLNATQSYLKAFECNYQTANKEACKLMVIPGIRAEIDRLKEIKYQSIMLNVDDIVEKHMRAAFAEITDYVEFGRTEIITGVTKQKVINLQTGKEEEREFPIFKTVNDVRFKESSEVDGSLISEVKVGKDGASIKLLDPQKSMDWLERYFQWNPMDRHKMDFDNKRLKLQERDLDIKQESVSKGQNITPNQGVCIVDDIAGVAK
jgi:phage terminase small subunit